MGVSLRTGQCISLAKQGAGRLTTVRMGLGWDAKKKKGLFGRLKEQAVDLDASCLLYGADRRLLDSVWFQQLTSKDGAVRHTGDNLTGAGEGDDESVVVELLALPAAVQTLVFTVNSFTGQDFSRIENAFCRLVDETNQTELARYELSGSGTHNAQIMAKIGRDGSAWSMTAIGAVANGRTIQDLLPAVAGHL